MSNPYTFRYDCEVCGITPVLKDMGMCSVCTYGEADSVWEWVYQRWSGKELKPAQQYLRKMKSDLAKSNMEFSPELDSRVNKILSLKGEPNE